MKYFKFSEANEWEGETWHFYIPANDNVEAVALLNKGIKDKDEDSYKVHENLFDEAAVNILVDQDDEGDYYMTKHNKLEGKLDIAQIEKALESDEEHALSDLLYKGGICDIMEK